MNSNINLVTTAQYKLPFSVLDRLRYLNWIGKTLLGINIDEYIKLQYTSLWMLCE
jgi:hypothetical protein